jgi:hypothetical protein
LTKRPYTIAAALYYFTLERVFCFLRHVLFMLTVAFGGDRHGGSCILKIGKEPRHLLQHCGQPTVLPDRPKLREAVISAQK